MQKQSDNINPSKVPPHNLEAEQSVLGGILINNDAIDSILDVLTSDSFYREAHQIIFQAMIDLYNKSSIIDLITLSEYLTEQNKIDKTGGTEYLTSIIQDISTSAGISYHAEIVRDRYVRRKLLHECSTISESCLQNWHTTEELLEIADKAIFDVTENQAKDDCTHITDTIEESFKKLESVTATDGYVTGVPTGFIDFDRYTAGLQPSDLIIVAGRPSMGKTSFSLSVGLNAAKKTQEGIAIFSLEMSKMKITNRFLSNMSKIDSNKFRTGNLRDSEWSSLTHASGELSELPIFIDDSSTTVLDIKAKCRRLIKKHRICMVIIDYIQLIQGRRSAESRQIEVAEISRSLKLLAKDINVPVIALSQLNRKVEDRPNKRPQMADLRESGSIEQDADVIVFLYRDEVYNPTNDENRNVAEVNIAKQRDGEIGMFKLTFQKELAVFRDYAQQEIPYYHEIDERYDQKY